MNIVLRFFLFMGISAALTFSACGKGGGHEHGGAATQGHDNKGVEGGELLIFDTANMDVPIAEIEVGKHPVHIVIDSKGKFVYVTNAGDGNVSMIDVAEQKLSKQFRSGMRQPASLSGIRTKWQRKN